MTSLDQLDEINQKISDLEQRKTELDREISNHKKAMEKKLTTIAESLGYILVKQDQSKVEGGKLGRRRKPAKIKYRNGDHTWTGRGMTPRWVKEAEANGQNRTVFLV